MRARLHIAISALAALLVAACGEDERVTTRGPEPSDAASAVARVVLPPPTAAPARAVALLVGIDRYAPGSEPAKSPLRGCGNDVRAIERVLVERFGFEPDEVLVLLDDEATHEALVRAFCEHLIGRSGPGTEALFYFSGHGSRAPDLSGDEGAEGLDSTFLAFDSRAGERAGEYDLSDDELGSLVAALSARGARPTVITDSCHSGGGLRSGGGPTTRSVPVGARGLAPDGVESTLPFFPAEVDLLGDPSLALGEDTVHLAACADRELAQEVEVEGVPHGALSWALLQALERATPTTTYEALAHEVSARMAFAAPGQSTWAEGALERTLFDGTARALPGFACRKASGALLVQAGWLMGLGEGSRLTILDGNGEVELGHATVERVRATTAAARWVEPAPTRELPPAMRAQELERCAGQPLLTTHVAEGTSLELPDDLPGVERRSAGEEHDYVLREVDGATQLETRAGNVLWRAEPDADTATIAELGREVARERRWLGLTRLSLDRGTLPVEVTFREPTAEELEDLSKEVQRELASAQVRAADGQLGARALTVGGYGRNGWRLAMLELTNPHERELHIAVLSLAEDRSINQIWPARHERDNRLAPGEHKVVPVGVVAPENWRLERPMRDRYLIVSTATYADLSVFEHGPVLRGASTESGLPELLGLALQPTRGGSVRVEREGWGVATVDLLVIGPDG